MTRRLTSRLLASVLSALLILGAASALAEPEAFFSPNGGIRDRLLRAINLTRATIDLAIFDFTSGEMAGALLAARERGVVIRVVADARQAQGKHSEIPLLLDRGVKVRLVRGNGRGVMHHKFVIFDEKLLVTGSYNWTDSADRFNHENAIFVDNSAVIRRYQVYFEQLLNGSLSPSSRQPR